MATITPPTTTTTTAAAVLTETDVQAMSTAEIRVNLERCTRLTAHPTLLQRLPDGGEGIRQRHALFSAELQRRDSAAATATAAAAGASTESGPASTAQRLQRNEEAMLAESAAVARDMGDKYRHERVAVEATVRRMYEGAISEAEIQRIIRDVPEKFFLTYDETCAMEKNLAREARKAELQRLAAEAAKQSQHQA